MFVHGKLSFFCIVGSNEGILPRKTPLDRDLRGSILRFLPMNLDERRPGKEKSGERAEFTGVNEHLEPLFDTAWPSAGRLMAKNYRVPKILSPASPRPGTI
ncbi:hypothetical protein EKK97_10555 [Billgrantia tianxiuensis]|uniref:Uncharacterized protein n=1 Tax=Billgrantia tianxiuensis TaxID=2497861 RepID=A0A6I6SQ43_9GAMM|nr:hypothetical protein EKK97_10555 [Halomonas tianxiuensis]